MVEKMEWNAKKNTTIPQYLLECIIHIEWPSSCRYDSSKYSYSCSRNYMM